MKLTEKNMTVLYKNRKGKKVPFWNRSSYLSKGSSFKTSCIYAGAYNKIMQFTSFLSQNFEDRKQKQNKETLLSLLESICTMNWNCRSEL